MARVIRHEDGSTTTFTDSWEAAEKKEPEMETLPIWEKNMNAEQLAVIRHHEGPIVNYAGAGSGKTRALVHRIARLVDAGVDGRVILAVTFSKKAADEMNGRLRKLQVYDARVGTWHSLCLEIMKEDETEWASWEIDEGNRAKQVLKEITGFKGMSWEDADITKLMSYIGMCKANLIDPGTEASFEMARERGLPARADEAYGRYQVALEDRGILTFDDFLTYVHLHLTTALVKEGERVTRVPSDVNRLRWARRWNFLLQDEAQDANKAQVEIARMLASVHRNYMIVGDPAQSIYGFRGSKPDYLMAFKAEWNATEVSMCSNYRSCDAIVRAANALIRNGKARLPDDMAPMRGEEGSVEYRVAANLDDEANEFAGWIDTLTKDGAEYSDIACLYRTNAQSRALEEALLSKKIPYVIIGSTNFYERKEVKDILGYLRVAAGDDFESVKRCINAPFRYLGKAFVENISDAASIAADDGKVNWTHIVSSVSTRERVQDRQRRSAEEWCRIITEIQGDMQSAKQGLPESKPRSILERLVSRIRYIEWIDKSEGQESIENSQAANVRELCRVAEKFDTVQAFLAYIDENVKAAKKQRRDSQAGGERVVLMSIHRSKGLEWDHVFVAGLNEGILPHARGDIEEERRLAYVAITRARDSLRVSSVREMAMKTGVREVAPSLFVREMGLGETSAADKFSPEMAREIALSP